MVTVDDYEKLNGTLWFKAILWCEKMNGEVRP